MAMALCKHEHIGSVFHLSAGGEYHEQHEHNREHHDHRNRKDSYVCRSLALWMFQPDSAGCSLPHKILATDSDTPSRAEVPRRVAHPASESISGKQTGIALNVQFRSVIVAQNCWASQE